VANLSLSLRQCHDNNRVHPRQLHLVPPRAVFNTLHRVCQPVVFNTLYLVRPMTVCDKMYPVHQTVVFNTLYLVRLMTVFDAPFRYVRW
jgi:hypothetical protein